MYYTRLDGIRAIAVILVIFSHWLPANHFLNTLPNGVLGVHIFFVLSGFLISEILLNQRNNPLGNLKVLKQFYIRRTLRIFPIYYLTLLALFVFPRTPAFFKEDIIWFATYTGNIYFYLSGKFGFAAHLWTLACEEQFYLIWPFLLLFVSRNLLPYILIAVIVFGNLSVSIWPAEESRYILTMHCLETFGLGAMLAYIKKYNSTLLDLIKSPVYIAGITSFAVIFISSVMQYSLNTHLFRFMISLIGIGLVYYGIKSNGGLIDKLFSNSLMIYIGKVSYGMYLYHAFFPWLHQKITFRFFPSLRVIQEYQLISFVLNFILLLLVCHLSWKLIENPINGLKRKFEYQPVE